MRQREEGHGGEGGGYGDGHGYGGGGRGGGGTGDGGHRSSDEHLCEWRSWTELLIENRLLRLRIHFALCGYRWVGFMKWA